MSFSDYHVHSVFSDGKSTPEQIVCRALELGMDTIGFSDHSYTSFATHYCMAKEQIETYRRTVAELKKRYEGRIRILCGIEQDYYSDFPAEGFDYVIGSVHFIRAGGEYLPVDRSWDICKKDVKRYFGGDVYSYAEAYYELEGQVAEKTACDIVGHFDLVTKYNENGAWFDESQPRYVASARAAVDRLLPACSRFEINTGAISRGYRVTPYPSMSLTEYIRAKGGTFLLSSDSHDAKTLCNQFDRWSETYGFVLPDGGDRL